MKKSSNNKTKRKRSSSSKSNSKPPLRRSMRNKKIELYDQGKTALLNKVSPGNIGIFDRKKLHEYKGPTGKWTMYNRFDMEKMRKYIKNDTALNDKQFKSDYNGAKIKNPLNRSKSVKLVNIRDPNMRENEVIYTYVLRRMQIAVENGEFIK